MEFVSGRCHFPSRAAGFSLRGAAPSYDAATVFAGPRGLKPAARVAPGGNRHAGTGRAFTLVEMVVVVAVILIILALVLPAASKLWKERRASEAQTLLQGVLMTSRARAMQADGVDTGFLALVDEEGVQHLLPIEGAQPPAANPAAWAAWENVFVIRDERDQVLPAPIRIVPRYVVQDEDTNPGAEGFNLFSEEELADNSFDDPPGDQAQRHRNFFTVVFSPEGQLRVGRDVLIRDPDADQPPDGIGDRTGLTVGPGLPASPPYTAQYYAQDNTVTPIDPNGIETIDFLITDEDGTAINFPSVDGLLVYDDSLLGGLGAAEKREFLLRAAQPLYVSRWTGTVVRGPVGEMPRTP